MRVIKIDKPDQKIYYQNKPKKFDLVIELIKEGASCNFYGLVKGTDWQVFDINITIHHKAPNTNSRVLLKAVLMDGSQLNFNGMIKIDPKAQLVDAYLKNDNLLIGDDAIVNSVPQLEIEANDVKASHGVTISTIDELQLHYLQSRGLEAKVAEALIVDGFLL